MMHFQRKLLPVALLAACLPACGQDLNLFGGPGGLRVTSPPCAEITAAALSWYLRGFEAADILDPDLRGPRELTAVMHVGDVKRLYVHAPSIAGLVNCPEKAAAVEWVVSNGVVARFQPGENFREASLVARQPGDTVVSATVGFSDGTPTLQVFPWSFTNIGSGNVTVVRVVP
jgi:hypothetical protein